MGKYTEENIMTTAKAIRIHPEYIGRCKHCNIPLYLKDEKIVSGIKAECPYGEHQPETSNNDGMSDSKGEDNGN